MEAHALDTQGDRTTGLKGKRVRIVGTGATGTGAQIVPEILQFCEHLVVFQRTPAWAILRHDHYISPMRKAIYMYVPSRRKPYRPSMMDERKGLLELLPVPNTPTLPGCRAVTCTRM